MFRRRYRMRRLLFLRIEGVVTAHDIYFIQKTDTVGVCGLSSLRKIIVALRMLAYGTTTDSVDEYIRIGESTAIESLKRFVKAIVEVFGPEYLRRPNREDTSRLLAFAEQRGFPGHVHEPTIILEAIASYDLWIWHSFFGLPRSLNDINVLECCNLDFAAAQEAARKDVERVFGVLQSRFAIIRGPS
ncbi:uncharacterized protein LOC141719843 [Apium graveolens]|uniref:uncharacterized protein LOC141719843 n=1 Tax=Apium graveolens TaxID=4045 RepID=UPI003D790805